MAMDVEPVTSPGVRRRAATIGAPRPVSTDPGTRSSRSRSCSLSRA